MVAMKILVFFILCCSCLCKKQQKRQHVAVNLQIQDNGGVYSAADIYHPSARKMLVQQPLQVRRTPVPVIDYRIMQARVNNPLYTPAGKMMFNRQDIHQFKSSPFFSSHGTALLRRQGTHEHASEPYEFGTHTFDSSFYPETTHQVIKPHINGIERHAYRPLFYPQRTSLLQEKIIQPHYSNAYQFRKQVYSPLFHPDRSLVLQKQRITHHVFQPYTSDSHEFGSYTYSPLFHHQTGQLRASNTHPLLQPHVSDLHVFEPHTYSPLFHPKSSYTLQKQVKTTNTQVSGSHVYRPLFTNKLLFARSPPTHTLLYKDPLHFAEQSHHVVLPYQHTFENSIHYYQPSPHYLEINGTLHKIGPIQKGEEHLKQLYNSPVPAYNYVPKASNRLSDFGKYSHSQHTLHHTQHHQFKPHLLNTFETATKRYISPVVGDYSNSYQNIGYADNIGDDNY